MHPEEISLKWLGSGGFEIKFAGRTLLVDPYLSRPYDALPSMPVTRHDFKKYDMLVSTHAKQNGIADVAYLASTVDAPVYMTEAGRKETKKAWRNLHYSARTGNPDNWRSIETAAKIRLGALGMTPLKTSTEGADLSNAVGMLKRMFSFGSMDEAIRRGVDYATSNPFGPSFAMHLDWDSPGTRIVFAGMLPKHIFDAGVSMNKVDVLALPYCPQNANWSKDTARLIERFQPRAVLAHQFDQWLPPITNKLDVNRYKESIKARFSGVRVFVPDPLKEFTLEDLVGK